MKQIYFAFLFILFCFVENFAQQPHYFSYTDENGLPSNEVYSIVQDSKGFIWIGCDAGLHKFDGIKFIPYTSDEQKSKSMTGLTISSAGKIYCYNFQSQLFCIEDDSLKILHVNFVKINKLACDTKGNLYISHSQGISIYNEILKTWNHDQWTETASSVDVDKNDIAHFITEKGVAKIIDKKIIVQPSDVFKQAAGYLLCHLSDQKIAFSNHNNHIYQISDKQTIPLTQGALVQTLQNRKITHAKMLSDGHLWICTYKGLVQYNIQTQQAFLYYPDISFSDIIIDYEGNYWCTTLHSGLMRIPSLDFMVWNKENTLLTNDKITKLATDNQHIFFTSVNGTIGKLHTLNYNLQTFHTNLHGDAQSLDYSFEDNCLYFNINGNLFFLKNGKIHQKANHIVTMKSLQKINQDYCVVSSLGTYIVAEKPHKISEIWARNLQYKSQTHEIWIASNQGLLQATIIDKKWKITDTLLTTVQILSLDFDEKEQKLYILTFDGKIFTMTTNEPQLLCTLPKNYQANQLKYYKQEIFIATNNGVAFYNTISQQWRFFNRYSGLASNNVQDLLILNENLWVATGKGLQKIPLHSVVEKPLAKVYLKKQPKKLNLHYNESLILFPEASIYSSNGNFEYAYRINQQEWIKLPSNIEQIEIQNVPIGNYEIELKVIDHLGRNSINTIQWKGKMIPPFWLRWWFFMVCVFICGMILWLIIKKRITKIQKRAEEKALLADSQLIAIKAQMNPHFIFNVLNSIKSYVYENDKEKATEYLDDFSDFMRKTLEASHTQYTSLGDEIQMIKLYAELEGMMLSGEFTFVVHISENLDIQMKIPTMIIQPFIENACKHGLRHKKGEKKLTISVLSMKNGIEIEIIDNGIGRKKAEEINNQNAYKKTSFATQAIEKRLSLINSQGKLHIEMKTIDLFNAENEATGTKVIIYITNKEVKNESDNH